MSFLRKNNKQKNNDLSATMSIYTRLENEIDNLSISVNEVQNALEHNKSSKIISNLNDKVRDIMNKISSLLKISSFRDNHVNPSSESFKKLIKTEKQKKNEIFVKENQVSIYNIIESNAIYLV